MGHEGVLELHRGDPFPAGLDDVLGPVGDLDEAEGVDRPHVTGAQPPLVELLRGIHAVVGARDPRPAGFDLPGGGAVPGQKPAGVVAQPEFDAVEGAAGLGPPGHLLASRRAGRREGDGG